MFGEQERVVGGGSGAEIGKIGSVNSECSDNLSQSVPFLSPTEHPSR